MKKKPILRNGLLCHTGNYIMPYFKKRITQTAWARYQLNCFISLSVYLLKIKSITITTLNVLKFRFITVLLRFMHWDSQILKFLSASSFDHVGGYSVVDKAARILFSIRAKVPRRSVWTRHWLKKKRKISDEVDWGVRESVVLMKGSSTIVPNGPN